MATLISPRQLKRPCKCVIGTLSAGSHLADRGVAVGERGVTANWAVTEGAGLRARVVITEGEQTFLRNWLVGNGKRAQKLDGPQGAQQDRVGGTRT